MVSAKRWAQTFKMTEDEFNDYLKKLNYQIWMDVGIDKKESLWHVTQKGRQHSRISMNPFHRIILWDFDAAFAVMKIKGKTSREYFYCDECDVYLPRQSGFEPSMQRWVCKKCGHVNKLFYDPADYL